jgi:hypothetical protein
MKVDLNISDLILILDDFSQLYKSYFPFMRTKVSISCKVQRK